MNNYKKIIVGITLSLAMGSVGLINACKNEKEVKTTEEINTVATALPVVAPDKDVNVNVRVDNPQQPETDTKRTDVTNVIVDKPDNTRLNNDIANVNTNLLKLQAQINTANEQTKAQLNKQIQQMNSEKQKLQQQMAEFATKTREANTIALKNAIENSRVQLEKTKQEFVQLTQARIDNFKKKMDTLKDKVNYLADTERTEVDKQVSKIESQTDAIIQKITVFDSSIDSTSFISLRTQTDTMIADLERSYNRLVTDKVSLR